MFLAELSCFDSSLLLASPNNHIQNYCVEISVGSNLVRFGGSFGFLRFGRFEVRFLGVK